MNYRVESSTIWKSLWIANGDTRPGEDIWLIIVSRRLPDKDELDLMLCYKLINDYSSVIREDKVELIAIITATRPIDVMRDSAAQQIYN